MTYAELREAIDVEIVDLDCVWFADHVQQLSVEVDLDLANQVRDEAEDLVRTGLIGDAERRLECFLRPKWPDVESCEDVYRETMNR